MDAGGRATQEAKADDYMDAGGRATLEAKAEGPPNAASHSIFVISMEQSDEKSQYAANYLTRYLPAVDMTNKGARSI
jgi:hypothetical protein